MRTGKTNHAIGFLANLFEQGMRGKDDKFLGMPRPYKPKKKPTKGAFGNKNKKIRLDK